jgi:hypothetical protein
METNKQKANRLMMQLVAKVIDEPVERVPLSLEILVEDIVDAIIQAAIEP